MNTDPNTHINENLNPTQPIETQEAPVPQVAQEAASKTPSVVVSNNSSGIPGWFYFIFGITLIVFFIVTTLLVLQIIQKPSSPGVNIVPQVTATKMPTPTVAADPAVSRLNDVGTSDDLASIEVDIKNTDLESWGEEMNAVETQINSSF